MVILLQSRFGNLLARCDSTLYGKINVTPHKLSNKPPLFINTKLFSHTDLAAML